MAARCPADSSSGITVGTSCANPDLHGYYTPVSHVPVSGLDRLSTDRVDEVVVFSFGYFDEIAESLAEYRAQGGWLTSLLDLL